MIIKNGDLVRSVDGDFEGLGAGLHDVEARHVACSVDDKGAPAEVEVAYHAA